MKKRLFKEPNERWSPDATELDAELHRAIDPICKAWAEKGYSMRDFHYVATTGILDIILYHQMKGEAGL